MRRNNCPEVLRGPFERLNTIFSYLCENSNHIHMKVVRVHPDENKMRARRKIEYVRNGQKMCSSIFVALPKGGGTYSRDTSHRFVFCLKGSVRIDTRFYWDEVMAEGQMAYVPGGWNLYLKALEESEVLIFSCASLYFGGDDELLDYLSENRGDTEIHFLRMEDNLKELVRDIASKTATKRFVLGEICESWRMQLMITLETYYPKEDLAAFLCRASSQKVDFRTMVTNAYGDAGRSVERLAKLCGMSRGTLYNRFKEEFGVMPNDWMNERTKEDMLQAAGIRNITNEGLGYVMKMTQSQLCHFIRKHFDCTPQELIDSRR